MKQLATKALFALAVGCGAVPGALAQVNVQNIVAPSDIGNQMTATVSIDYIRTSAAAGTASIVLPATLGVNPPVLPAGCVFVGPSTVQCAVPPGATGATGLIPFSVRGLSVGTYNLVGSGTGQAGSASNNGSVRDSGDLTVSKILTVPVGTPTTGQNITFRLVPNTVGDGIPAGSSIVVTDQLPGGPTDFNATGAVVTPGAAANCVINNGARTVACTFSGPLTAAAFNAVTIDITGTAANSGNFVNNASIATTNNLYFDRVAGNNTASVSYTVSPGADVAPTGSSFPANTLVDTTQTLSLVFKNNGPATVPAGGTVAAQVPVGFTVGALPAGCAFAAPTITCTAGAVNNGNTQTFAIPIGNPAVASAGNITVTVASPVGVTDYNLGNNVLLLPYSVVPPTGDLAISKTKTTGPLPEGAPIVNTLSVRNADISTVTFTAAGGANPLRIIDDMLNQEVFVSGSAGWTCVDNPGVPSATQHRVICEHTLAGTLAPGANIPLTINTQVTSTIGATPVNLTNTACTGKQALNLLGLTDADAPQPRDPNTANDCQSRGVIGTPVTTGEAEVTIVKESSVDGVTWVDAPAAGPTIVGNNEFAFWRVRIAAPSTVTNAAQQTIPTLVLTDNLPGILNLAASLPTPAHVTPPITITQVVTGMGVTGACPATIGPGSGALSCSFTNMQQGTTITLVIQVKRPFDSGQLDNTASLSSGSAILSGTTSDAARLIVEPRVDPAVTSKTITPPNSATEPRVGQTVTFTITMRNHGVNPIPAGNMTLTDTLDPAKYAILSATGANLNCSIVAATGVVTCATTNAVPRTSVRTAAIVARLIKPGGVLANPVYAAETNTATVTLSGGLCEFKEEASSNALLSTACNDANSTSNNVGTVGFDIKVPAIDLQTAKSRITPPGGSYVAGDTLKYLIRMQNAGPSRAEEVVLADYLTVPTGFTVASTAATLVNNAAAGSGFVLDSAKTIATVNCSISTTSSLRCVLDSTPALNYLDNGREVNFVLEVTYAGPAPSAPATFQNQVVICAAETATTFEARGACSTATTIVTPGDNNNTASANDTVFPKVDLGITKATITPSPVVANQPIQYRLTVRNDGPSPISQIRVADALPPNVEYISSAVALSSYVTGSGTTAVTPVCSPTPAAITAAGQSQTLNCVLNAVGGPFVGSTLAANTISIVVTARAKVPFFTGPYLTDLTNTASVAVGLDGGGDPLAVDSNPANNTATAVVQVQRTSIGGKVYQDVNLNREPTGPGDINQPNVPITLTGTDLFGNSVTLATTTAINGSYSFDLPPGTYQISKGADPAGLTDFTANVPTKLPFGTTTAPVSPGTPATTMPGTPTSASLLTAIQLAAGDAATGYNFGEISGGASIAGKVYVDRNDDGAFLAPDVGIPGVTVALTGLDVFGTSITRTTVTDALGNYAFPNLFAGTYTVTEPNQPATANGATLPGGFATTVNGKTTVGTGAAAGQGTATLATVVPSSISGISLSLGETSINNNFGELLPSSISGKVFFDANNNGVQNAPADLPLSGVVLLLTGVNDLGQAVNLSTITSGSGTYSFTDLRPGTYTVTEPNQPPNTGNGITTAGPATPGGTAGVSTAASVLPSSIQNIVIPRGVASINNDFAEITAPPSAAILGSIAGRVWLDTNNNGVIDPGEPGIGGVTVVLTGTTTVGLAPVTQTLLTRADGQYEFLNLEDGTYRVTQPQQPSTANGAGLPPGISQTSQGVTTVGVGASSQGTATPPSVVISEIGPIRLGAGQTSINNNFGEIAPSMISGVVYLDNNLNGVRDAGDTTIPNVTVTLAGTDSNGQPVVGTAVTDANGRYDFTNLPNGVYTVTQPTQPPGTENAETNPGTINNGGTVGTATLKTVVPSAVSGIRINAPGTISPDNNFGEIQLSTIAGFVYLDNNTSGLRDANDAPIAGVTITLSGTDDLGRAVTRTTTTDASGRYEFAGLRAGTYTVTEPTQPPDTINWETNPGGMTNGGTAGTATGRSVVPSAISAIRITRPGTVSDNNNFGEIVPSTISGFVYFDTTKNGTRDTADTPIAGVTVVLTGTDDMGRSVTITTVTDATGRYEFPGLRPGTYNVTEPTQPPGTDNAETNPGTINNGGTPGTPTGRPTVPSAVNGIRIINGGTLSPDNNFGETGGAPDLVVTKTARTAFFTENNSGDYDISVRNNGPQPTVGDYAAYDLLPITSPQVWKIESASGAGWSCSVGADGLSLACKSAVVLAAGAFHPGSIQVRVSIAEGAKARAPLRNFTLVRGGGELPAIDPLPGRTVDPGLPGAPTEGDLRNLIPVAPPCIDNLSAVSQNFCVRETPIRLSVALGGRVWLDGPGTPNTYEPGIDKNYPGWRILVVDPALYDRTQPGPIPPGAIVRQTTTGPDGSYRVINLVPGILYDVFFQDPDGRTIFAGPVNGNNRNPQACGRSPTGGNAPSRTVFLEVTLPEGRVSNEVTCDEQSLPIDPNGVVYDSSSRTTVPGAIVTLRPEGICTGYDPRLHIVGYNQFTSFDSQGNPQMTVGADGFYKFLLTANAPASCLFRLDVTPPPGFTGPSTLIPPSPPLQTPVGVGVVFNVQPQDTAPTGSQTTTYHIVVRSGSTHNDVFNNHIPLDRQSPGDLRIVKTGSVRSIELGDTMEYTVAVTKWNGVQLNTVRAIDTLPAGFRYIPGTFRINGSVQANPAGGIGPVLTFELPNLVAGQTVNFTYRVRVGVGAQEGDGINRVRAKGQAGPVTIASNIAEYRVRVDGGVFTNEACVIGKVYVDCNNNHMQDNEEIGIPGVRLYFDDGTFMVSDVEGKYSVCGRQPRTYTLKADPSTLPRGSRLTTTSGRNVGDANSLFVDLKNGEMQRADFAEGSCSNTVMEQVKARRTRGEVSAPETERKGGPALKFQSKGFGAPEQATDSANQPFLQPRDRGGAPPARTLETEQLVPVPQLPAGIAPALSVPSGPTTRPAQ